MKLLYCFVVRDNKDYRRGFLYLMMGLFYLSCIG